MSLPWRELFCAAALLAVTSNQQATLGQEPPPQPNQQARVQVFLTAAQKKDSPALLDPSKLTVLVDKQPARVSALRPAKSDALLFGLLVDRSKSDDSVSELVRKAAFEVFQALSSEGGRGYLVLFNQTVAISKQPLQVSQAQAYLNSIKFGGGTAVYDAIEEACLHPLSRSGTPESERRAIVLISDGEDNASHVNDLEAEQAAEKEGVAVFSMVTTSPLAGLQGEHVLQEISHNTGGDAIIRVDLNDAIAPLLAAIRNQWVLTLVPAQPADQQLHSLTVKTSQKGVHISAPTRVLIQ